MVNIVKGKIVKVEKQTNNHKTIEGVNLDIEAIAATNPTLESLKKEDLYFSHLPAKGKEAAYAQLADAVGAKKK